MGTGGRKNAAVGAQLDRTSTEMNCAGIWEGGGGRKTSSQCWGGKDECTSSGVNPSGGSEEKEKEFLSAATVSRIWSEGEEAGDPAREKDAGEGFGKCTRGTCNEDGDARTDRVQCLWPSGGGVPASLGTGHGEDWQLGGQKVGLAKVVRFFSLEQSGVWNAQRLAFRKQSGVARLVVRRRGSEKGSFGSKPCVSVSPSGACTDT